MPESRSSYKQSIAGLILSNSDRSAPLLLFPQRPFALLAQHLLPPLAQPPSFPSLSIWAHQRNTWRCSWTHPESHYSNCTTPLSVKNINAASWYALLRLNSIEPSRWSRKHGFGGLWTARRRSEKIYWGAWGGGGELINGDKLAGGGENWAS